METEKKHTSVYIKRHKSEIRDKQNVTKAEKVEYTMPFQNPDTSTTPQNITINVPVNTTGTENKRLHYFKIMKGIYLTLSTSIVIILLLGLISMSLKDRQISKMTVDIHKADQSQGFIKDLPPRNYDDLKNAVFITQPTYDDDMFPINDDYNLMDLNFDNRRKRSTSYDQIQNYQKKCTLNSLTDFCKDLLKSIKNLDDGLKNDISNYFNDMLTDYKITNNIVKEEKSNNIDSSARIASKYEYLNDAAITNENSNINNQQIPAVFIDLNKFYIRTNTDSSTETNNKNIKNTLNKPINSPKKFARGSRSLKSESATEIHTLVTEFSSKSLEHIDLNFNESTESNRDAEKESPVLQLERNEAGSANRIIHAHNNHFTSPKGTNFNENNDQGSVTSENMKSASQVIFSSGAPQTTMPLCYLIQAPVPQPQYGPMPLGDIVFPSSSSEINNHQGISPRANDVTGYGFQPCSYTMPSQCFPMPYSTPITVNPSQKFNNFQPTLFASYNQQPQFYQICLNNNMQTQQVNQVPFVSAVPDFASNSNTTPENDYHDDNSISSRYRSVETILNLIYGKHDFEVSNRESSCDKDSLQCVSDGKCLNPNQWCDGTVDCEDGSDEGHCPCKSRLHESRICDGYYDCPLGEDELGCSKCGNFSFNCNEWSRKKPTSNCFEIHERCDGFHHCFNDRDEKECSMLHPIVDHHPPFGVSHFEGFLHKNFKGKWYPVCETPFQWAIDACVTEVGSIESPPIINLKKSDAFKGKYIRINSSGMTEFTDECPGGIVYVTCASLTCGIRNQLTTNEELPDDALFERRKRHIEYTPIVDFKNIFVEEDYENQEIDFNYNNEQYINDEYDNIYENFEDDNVQYENLIYEPLVPEPYTDLHSEIPSEDFYNFKYVNYDQYSAHRPNVYDYADTPNEQYETGLYKIYPQHYQTDDKDDGIYTVNRNNILYKLEEIGSNLNILSKPTYDYGYITTMSTNYYENDKSKNRVVEEINENTNQSTVYNQNNNVTLKSDSKNNSSDPVRGKRGQGRVVGGTTSAPAAWPWIVAIYRNGKFHCGGALLNEKWVLSAAHCVVKFWHFYYEIRAGMLRRFSYSSQEQTRFVIRIVSHDLYEKESMINDLSLLLLDKPVLMNKWVRPGCLPSPATAGQNWLWGPLPGVLCTAVGWGATVEHGPDPDHLREVDVPIIRTCKHSEDRKGQEICAGRNEGGKDACQGDSGGPFMCKNPTNPKQWYIAGVVSHGEGCARKNEPGVYTRVSIFMDWISDNMNEKNIFRQSRAPKTVCPGFSCTHGIKRCLPAKYRCDNEIHCLGGEDEINCHKESIVGMSIGDDLNSEEVVSSENLESDNKTSSDIKQDSVSETKMVSETTETGNVSTENLESDNKTSSDIKQDIVSETKTVSETTETGNVSTDKTTLKYSENFQLDRSASKEKFEGIETSTSLLMTSNPLNFEKISYSSVKFNDLINSDLPTESILRNNEYFEASGDDSTGHLESADSSKDILKFNPEIDINSLTTKNNIDDSSLKSETVFEISSTENPLKESLFTNPSEIHKQFDKAREVFENTTVLPKNADFQASNDSNSFESIDVTATTSETFPKSLNNNLIGNNTNTTMNDFSKSLINNIIPDSTNNSTIENSHPLIIQPEFFSENGTTSTFRSIMNLEETETTLSNREETPSFDLEIKSIDDAPTTINTFDRPKNLNFNEAPDINPLFDDINGQSNINKKELVIQNPFANSNGIIMLPENILNMEPVSSGSPARRTEKFHAKYFNCKRIPQRIPQYKRCDKLADCEDGTDEVDCSCAEYIINTHPSAICDGYFDCEDGSDEKDCYTCPPTFFLCKLSRTCIPNNNVCDRQRDCLFGEDEIDCFTLYKDKKVLYDKDGHPHLNTEGILALRRQNDWQPVCQRTWTKMEKDIAASYICQYFDFTDFESHSTVQLNENDKQTSQLTNSSLPQYHHNYYKRHTESLHNDIPLNVPSNCTTLQVKCSNYPSGSPALYLSISNNQSSVDTFINDDNSIYVWPWIGKIYIEGMYACTGVLIDNSWILTEKSCLKDINIRYTYVTVELGTKKSFPDVKSPYEQIIRVDYIHHIVLINTITMLHLQYEAHIDRYTKLIPMPDFDMHIYAQDDICVAVGVDNRGSPQSVFLNPTEIQCGLSNRCFQRRNPSTDCQRRISDHWKGIVVCHRNNQWYPAASFYEPSGFCGFTGRISLFNLGYVRHDIKIIIDTFMNPETLVPDCVGVRCDLGQCVVPSNVCNGIPDCKEGTDENAYNCDYKNNYCSDAPHDSVCKCTVSEMKCADGRCVSKQLFANGVNDCSDGDDEPKLTTCHSYLERTAPHKLCDGVRHCKDKTDEDPKFCNCYAKNSYKCPNAHYCIPYDFICDGDHDCPGGEDEVLCMSLRNYNSTFREGSGEVIVRKYGLWYPKCFHKPNFSKFELEEICDQLGYRNRHAVQYSPPMNQTQEPINRVVTDEFTDVSFTAAVINLRTSNYPYAWLETVPDSEKCYRLYIECL